MTFIREGVDDIGVYVGMWNARKPLPAPDAAARLAGEQAIERVDMTIRRLWRLRLRLEREIAAEDSAWLALDDEPEA
ncbi:hypothetical protein AB0I34_06960 [Kribbella sp. NPDC050281]|uniref:hypothetical protein n=1 Tax=Kribbella sp. NPDC050281 TaxID=3155515 RepID=UPI0033EF7E06